MKNILSVDDEQYVLKLIERKLEGTDLTCYFANSGEDAIEILNERDIDVMVADVHMPDVNGLDLMKDAIRLSPHTLRIILSGNARAASIIDAINEGHVYKYLTKPWRVDSGAIELLQDAIQLSKKWRNEVVSEPCVSIAVVKKISQLAEWVVTDSVGHIIESSGSEVADELCNLPFEVIADGRHNLRLYDLSGK